MPDDYGPDDATSDLLAGLLRELRAVADRPAPAPTASLARVLQSGFSEPLVPLATAPSHPSAGRLAARRRPKENHDPSMTSTRIFRGLTGKVIAVSTTLLIGVSTAAAAGALPFGAQHVVAAAVHSVTAVQLPDASGSISTTASAHAGSANLNAAASTGARTAAHGSGTAGFTGGANAGAAGVNGGASAHATAGTSAGAGVGATASVSGRASSSRVAGTAAGALSTATTATNEVTACLTKVIGSASGPPLAAVGTVLPTLLACVQNVLSALPVPPAITSCVSSLINSLGSLPVIGTGNGTVSLNGCIPLDLSSCLQALVGSIGGLAGSGVTSLIGAVTACANTIVTSILNLVKGVLGQATGTVSGAIHGAGAGVGAGFSAGASVSRHVKH